MTRLAPFVLLLPQAYVTLLALVGRSRNPIVGPYSLSLLLFNIALVGLSGAAVVALWRRAYGVTAVALVGLGLLSYPLGTNNQILAAPFAVPAIVLSRVGLAACLVPLAFAAGRSVAGRRILALGSTLLVMAAADGVLLAAAARPPSIAHGGFEFREPVDLAFVPRDGIAIVGDSFVYGSGVEEAEAFPTLLARWAGKRPVYNLGQRGAGLPEYLGVLRALPPTDTAVVCFYMNDMPSRETRALKLAQVLAGARRTSAFCRLASDFLSVRELPEIDSYERWVVGDYDRTDPTFPSRWAQLERDLREVAVEARRVSRSRPPLFVVFPLMQRFSEYPLVHAHRDLGALAASLGFEVMDLLPVFAREFPDGRRFRTAPNDGHFDARVHAEVARQLASRLFSR